MRPAVVIFVVVSGWAALAARLVQLQHIDRHTLAAMAENQRMAREVISARPGDILDREGRLLATSVVSRSLWIDPSRFQYRWTLAVQLGEALDEEPRALFDRIQKAQSRRFLWIRRRVTNEQAERVRKLRLAKGAWGFRDEYQRKYPHGSLAAHVLGLRNIDNRGRGGIEESMDDELRGTPGRRTLVRDARGRIIGVQQDVAVPAKPGESVRLTLDSVVQLIAERQLQSLAKRWKPKSCTAIVLNPRNGDVLAMASLPTFDPNQPNQIDQRAWKNTAVASIFEPGSTMKPMIVAWALREGVVKKTDQFDGEQGAYRMGPRVLRDHYPFGMLSLADILIKSSNVGIAKVGERMGNKRLYDAVVSFGFGRPTGIELAGELPGIVRSLTRWNGYSTGSVPMGQEISVTPLQMIVAHAALANGGVWKAPRLVHSLEKSVTGETREMRRDLPAVTARIVETEIADWVVRQAMRQVITRGTGRLANIPGLSVFGKTGTAQKPTPSGTYSSSKHIVSAIVGAPAENPELLVFVLVDEPTVAGRHYGGTVAAPFAARILDGTMKYMHRVR